jgi:two-component sensor histidine kinase
MNNYLNLNNLNYVALNRSNVALNRSNVALNRSNVALNNTIKLVKELNNKIESLSIIVHYLFKNTSNTQINSKNFYKKIIKELIQSEKDKLNSVEDIDFLNCLETKINEF